MNCIQKENRELKERITTLSKDKSNQLPAQQPNQGFNACIKAIYILVIIARIIHILCYIAQKL